MNLYCVISLSLLEYKFIVFLKSAMDAFITIFNYAMEK